MWNYRELWCICPPLFRSWPNSVLCYPTSSPRPSALTSRKHGGLYRQPAEQPSTGSLSSNRSAEVDHRRTSSFRVPRIRRRVPNPPVANFINHLQAALAKISFLLKSNNPICENTKGSHKRFTKYFCMKKPLVKCCWNWHLMSRVDRRNAGCNPKGHHLTEKRWHQTVSLNYGLEMVTWNYVIKNPEW